MALILSSCDRCGVRAGGCSKGVRARAVQLVINACLYKRARRVFENACSASLRSAPTSEVTALVAALKPAPYEYVCKSNDAATADDADDAAYGLTSLSLEFVPDIWHPTAKRRACLMQEVPIK